MEKTKKVIRIPVRKMTVSVAVVILVIVVLLVLGLLSRSRMIVNYDLSETGGTTQSVNYGYKMMSPGYPIPYQNSPSINDTREFLKTSYNAEIKTRDVKYVMRNVKSAITVAKGRIDSSSENEKAGYVSFVVPKSNFESFKDEIASITNKKLIIENASSENLLSQKQYIEEQNRVTKSSLTALQKEQKDLTAKHTQVIGKLRESLAGYKDNLLQVQRSISLTSDSALLSSLKVQEINLNQNIASLEQSIDSENSSFDINNQNVKNEIDKVNIQLKGIAKQDADFTDNIDTVVGSVYVHWVSLWTLAKIFSPISPVIIIIILAIVVWYILRKKEYLPKVEFV